MAPTDAIPNLAVSPGQQTPPSSPNLHPYKPVLHPEQVQLFADLLKAVQAIQPTPAAAGAGQPVTTEETAGDESVSREKGSKLEVKSVVELYAIFTKLGLMNADSCTGGTQDQQVQARRTFS